MSKGFWGVIAAIFIVFAGLVVLGGDKTEAPSSGGSKLTQHVLGQGTTGVTLVEYGDYQCPYCQQYEPTVEAAIAKFGDQIKFQFRHFPITSAHPNAFAAARAAEAASYQGKFWEMHRGLYQSGNYQQWTQATNPNTFFDQYAKQLNLNVAQFKKDFASSKANDAINADLAEATKQGVTATPTFFLDGKKTEIGNDLASFEKVIQAAIDKKAKTETPAASN